MVAAQPIAIFFHGLNTYGDDLLHLGPVVLGRMDRFLVPEFERHGVRFISINGIGDGTLEAQAEHALKQIRTIPNLEETSVHLLGNSLGGLIARIVATELKVSTVCSWGSPHLGAAAADLALKFPGRYPRVTATLAKLGYTVGKNREVYRHYSSEGLQEFNRKYPEQKSTPEHSFVCAVPLRDVSPYFWPLYAPLHEIGTREFAKRMLLTSTEIADSDGFITVASQSRGVVHGPYYLDHFVQSGFTSMMPTRAQRAKARLEFEKLCFDMAQVILRPVR